MDFSEAMDKVKEGFKVSREPWRNEIYFSIKQGMFDSYKSYINYYAYSEDIMVSEDWLIEGDEKEYRFCEIIPFLQKGCKARLSNWNDKFIYLDKSEKRLVISFKERFDFTPAFDDFLAEDWVVLQ